MSETSRLALAVESGLVAWPEGARIAVFAPRSGMDLGAIPQEGAHLVTGFRPDHEHFVAQGWTCARSPKGRYDSAVVFAARSKRLSQAMIAEAMSVTDGAVIVDGAKTDGIEALLKACRARTDVSAPLSKAHGKLFVLTAGPGFEDWAMGGPQRIDDRFVTLPGVFSADAVDPGSALLAEALPAKLGARVVDLGAGWGYLSARILERDTVAHLDLVEAEAAALECARRNVPDTRAQFHWADATRWRPEAPVDTVIMNPPFHQGRKGAPDLGQSFIAAAAEMLSPRGQLFMVANRHLPYEATLSARFAQVEELTGDGRFKVFHATRPSRPRR